MYVDCTATKVTFYGSNGTAVSYDLTGGCNGASDYYGTGSVDFYGDSDKQQPTGQWTVIAVIPDCSGDFLWKWRVTGGNHESTQNGDRKLPHELLIETHLSVFSILGQHSHESYGKVKILYFMLSYLMSSLISFSYMFDIHDYN